MASVDFRVRKGIDAQHLVLQDQSTDPANVTDQTKILQNGRWRWKWYLF